MTSKTTVFVKEVLIQTIPNYLDRRAQDVETLRELIKSSDFNGIYQLSHRLHGSASTYGFHQLSRFAEEMMEAALTQQSTEISGILQQMQSHLYEIDVRVDPAHN